MRDYIFEEDKIFKGLLMDIKVYFKTYIINFESFSSFIIILGKKTWPFEPSPKIESNYYRLQIPFKKILQRFDAFVMDFNNLLNM